MEGKLEDCGMKAKGLNGLIDKYCNYFNMGLKEEESVKEYKSIIVTMKKQILLLKQKNNHLEAGLKG